MWCSEISPRFALSMVKLLFAPGVLELLSSAVSRLVVLQGRHVRMGWFHKGHCRRMRPVISPNSS